jgi:hypothetical protein
MVIVLHGQTFLDRCVTIARRSWPVPQSFDDAALPPSSVTDTVTLPIFSLFSRYLLRLVPVIAVGLARITLGYKEWWNPTMVDEWTTEPLTLLLAGR